MRRPVRCMLDRDEDMLMSGTRHPFLARYKFGFNKDGKIIAIKMTVYCNSGYSMDLTPGVSFYCTNNKLNKKFNF